jgi:glyoxylase-like metal-dependent hydrolase (beta-lactamase superfamily II)
MPFSGIFFDKNIKILNFNVDNSQVLWYNKSLNFLIGASFMQILPICPDSFASNTYLLISDGHALAVDPSVSIRAIVDGAKEHNATVEGILLTHGHFDHVFSLDGLRAELNIPAMIHAQDAELLTDGKKNAFFDLFGRERTYGAAERTLQDGEVISLGGETIRVLHTPGHTKGSVCYLCENALITGDTLFASGYGRCDLYGGDLAIMRSTLAKLRQLNGSLTIYPGHGPSAVLRDALDEVAYLI